MSVNHPTLAHRRIQQIFNEDYPPEDVATTITVTMRCYHLPGKNLQLAAWTGWLSELVDDASYGWRRLSILRLGYWPKPTTKVIFR